MFACSAQGPYKVICRDSTLPVTYIETTRLARSTHPIMYLPTVLHLYFTYMYSGTKHALKMLSAVSMSSGLYFVLGFMDLVAPM